MFGKFPKTGEVLLVASGVTVASLQERLSRMRLHLAVSEVSRAIKLGPFRDKASHRACQEADSCLETRLL